MKDKETAFGKVEEDAWKRFTSCFRDHAEQLYLYAIGFIGNSEDARDIVQDTFIYVWENREKLVITEGFKTYLFRTVKSACVNYKLHEKVKERYRTEKSWSGDQTEDSEDDFDEQYLRLQQIIETLPEKCREIFILGCVEELSYKEISEQLDISVNTVKTQMKIAYKKIKSDFGDKNLAMIGILFGSWLH